MTSLIFPDVNVMVALSSTRHVHHGVAMDWFNRSRSSPLILCRVTHLSFLRLLTTKAVMGDDVHSNDQAWQVSDRLFRLGLTHLRSEPGGFEATFREASSTKAASPKHWADAYLSAFAQVGGLQLITFDRALASATRGSEWLRT